MVTVKHMGATWVPGILLVPLKTPSSVLKPEEQRGGCFISGMDASTQTT